jgi:ABC-type nitrate/sulfonate/bicarbonate transport system substrate-binding protein
VRARWVSASRVGLAAAAVAAAVAVAGCGGGSDSGSGGSGSSSASGDGGLGTIKVVVSNQYDLAEPGVDAGLEQDIWKDSGLTVKQAVSEKGTDALAAGDADITIGSPNRVIGPIMQGLPVKLVGPTLNAWDQYIVVSKKGRYANATDPSQLKGAKFGISSFGSAGDYSTKKLAAKEGWAKTDYSEVTLGDLPGLIAGLKKGSIDAFAWSAITSYTMQEQGFGRVIGSVAKIVSPPPPLDVLVVSDDAIKNNPKAVKAFCDGYYGAQKSLKSDPKGTIDLLTNKWKVGPRSVVKDAVDSELPLLAEHGGFTQGQLEGMADATRQTTPSAKDVTADQVKSMTADCSTL